MYRFDLMGLCAFTCINRRAHFKDPVVHVRVWWIMETLKHPACTIGWVARLLQLWKAANFPWEKSQWDSSVEAKNNKIKYPIMPLLTLYRSCVCTFFFFFFPQLFSSMSCKNSPHLIPQAKKKKKMWKNKSAFLLYESERVAVSTNHNFLKSRV